MDIYKAAYLGLVLLLSLDIEPLPTDYDSDPIHIVTLDYEGQDDEPD